jgi:hypothetical protein
MFLLPPSSTRLRSKMLVRFADWGSMGCFLPFVRVEKPLQAAGKGTSVECHFEVKTTIK